MNLKNPEKELALQQHLPGRVDENNADLNQNGLSRIQVSIPGASEDKQKHSTATLGQFIIEIS
jgi:hypothetical protein